MSAPILVVVSRLVVVFFFSSSSSSFFFLPFLPFLSLHHSVINKSSICTWLMAKHHPTYPRQPISHCKWSQVNRHFFANPHVKVELCAPIFDKSRALIRTTNKAMGWKFLSHISFILTLCFTCPFLVWNVYAWKFDDYDCSTGNGLVLPRSNNRCKLAVYDNNLDGNNNFGIKLLNEVEHLSYNSAFGDNDDMSTVLLWGKKIAG